MAFLGVQRESLDGFAETLIKEGSISSEQLALAQVSQKNLGIDLGEVLVQKGILDREQCLRLLARYLKVDCGHIDDLKVDRKVVRKIAANVARRYRVLAILEEGEKVILAMADPTDRFAIAELERALDAPIKPMLVPLDDLEQAWADFYRVESVHTTQEHKTDKVDIVYEDEGIKGREDLQKIASGRKIIETLSQIISDAHDSKASDIHIEPSLDEVRIRMRIDGILEQKEAFPRSLHFPLVSRIKILAGMDIAERRQPQDGRVHIKVVGNPLDLRISTFPTLYGEKVVLRLLSKQQVLRIEDLGFSDRDRKTFSNIIEKNSGIFLVTGPTGSGKSTTLYAALSRINSPEKNIISVEDPIEHQIEGVNQAQVNTKAGMNFASALKAVLRQDPDVIMLGEIRDKETAEIAIRAAITGHLVLSTLHTNTAAGAITRLVDLGIEPFLVASSVQGIMAQRLVRQICPSCRQELKQELLEHKHNICTVCHDKLQKEEEEADEKAVVRRQFHGIGCNSCRLSGYKGRIGIFELAAISEQCRSLICRNASEEEINTLWRHEGVPEMEEDGRMKVEDGQTSLEEMERVNS
jgi:type IV pilus assembly protein PilB